MDGGGGDLVLVTIPVTREAAEALAADADRARRAGEWVSELLRHASRPMAGPAGAEVGGQSFPEPVGPLVRRGPLLVMPARPGERRVTLEEANVALDEVRSGDRGP